MSKEAEDAPPTDPPASEAPAESTDERAKEWFQWGREGQQPEEEQQEEVNSVVATTDDEDPAAVVAPATLSPPNVSPPVSPAKQPLDSPATVDVKGSPEKPASSGGVVSSLLLCDSFTHLCGPSDMPAVTATASPPIVTPVGAADGGALADSSDDEDDGVVETKDLGSLKDDEHVPSPGSLSNAKSEDTADFTGLKDRLLQTDFEQQKSALMLQHTGASFDCESDVEPPSSPQSSAVGTEPAPTDQLPIEDTSTATPLLEVPSDEIHEQRSMVEEVVTDSPLDAAAVESRDLQMDEPAAEEAAVVDAAASANVQELATRALEEQPVALHNSDSFSCDLPPADEEPPSTTVSSAPQEAVVETALTADEVSAEHMCSMGLCSDDDVGAAFSATTTTTPATTEEPDAPPVQTTAAAVPVVSNDVEEPASTVNNDFDDVRQKLAVDTADNNIGTTPVEPRARPLAVEELGSLLQTSDEEESNNDKTVDKDDGAALLSSPSDEFDSLTTPKGDPPPSTQEGTVPEDVSPSSKPEEPLSNSDSQVERSVLVEEQIIQESPTDEDFPGEVVENYSLPEPAISDVQASVDAEDEKIEAAPAPEPERKLRRRVVKRQATGDETSFRMALPDTAADPPQRRRGRKKNAPADQDGKTELSPNSMLRTRGGLLRQVTGDEASWQPPVHAKAESTEAVAVEDTPEVPTRRQRGVRRQATGDSASFYAALQGGGRRRGRRKNNGSSDTDSQASTQEEGSASAETESARPTRRCVQRQATGDESSFAAAMLSDKPKPRRGRRKPDGNSADRSGEVDSAGAKVEAVSPDLCHGEEATIVKDDTSSISENANQTEDQLVVDAARAESANNDEDQEQSFQSATDIPQTATTTESEFGEAGNVHSRVLEPDDESFKSALMLSAGGISTEQGEHETNAKDSDVKAVEHIEARPASGSTAVETCGSEYEPGGDDVVRPLEIEGDSVKSATSPASPVNEETEIEKNASILATPGAPLSNVCKSSASSCDPNVIVEEVGAARQIVQITDPIEPESHRGHSEVEELTVTSSVSGITEDRVDCISKVSTQQSCKTDASLDPVITVAKDGEILDSATDRETSELISNEVSKVSDRVLGDSNLPKQTKLAEICSTTVEEPIYNKTVRGDELTAALDGADMATSKCSEDPSPVEIGVKSACTPEPIEDGLVASTDDTGVELETTKSYHDAQDGNHVSSEVGPASMDNSVFEPEVEYTKTEAEGVSPAVSPKYEEERENVDAVVSKGEPTHLSPGLGASQTVVALDATDESHKDHSPDSESVIEVGPIAGADMIDPSSEASVCAIDKQGLTKYTNKASDTEISKTEDEAQEKTSHEESLLNASSLDEPELVADRTVEGATETTPEVIAGDKLGLTVFEDGGVTTVETVMLASSPEQHARNSETGVDVGPTTNGDEPTSDVQVPLTSTMEIVETECSDGGNTSQEACERNLQEESTSSEPVVKVDSVIDVELTEDVSTAAAVDTTLSDGGQVELAVAGADEGTPVLSDRAASTNISQEGHSESSDRENTSQEQRELNLQEESASPKPVVDAELMENVSTAAAADTTLSEGGQVELAVAGTDEGTPVLSDRGASTNISQEGHSESSDRENTSQEQRALNLQEESASPKPVVDAELMENVSTAAAADTTLSVGGQVDLAELAVAGTDEGTPVLSDNAVAASTNISQEGHSESNERENASQEPSERNLQEESTLSKPVVEVSVVEVVVTEDFSSAAAGGTTLSGGGKVELDEGTSVLCDHVVTERTNVSQEGSCESSERESSSQESCERNLQEEFTLPKPVVEVDAELTEDVSNVATLDTTLSEGGHTKLTVAGTDEGTPVISDGVVTETTISQEGRSESSERENSSRELCERNLQEESASLKSVVEVNSVVEAELTEDVSSTAAVDTTLSEGGQVELTAADNDEGTPVLSDDVVAETTNISQEGHSEDGDGATECGVGRCVDTVAPTNTEESDQTPTESAPDAAEATERESSTTNINPVDTELAQDPSNADLSGGEQGLSVVAVDDTTRGTNDATPVLSDSIEATSTSISHQGYVENSTRAVDVSSTKCDDVESNPIVPVNGETCDRSGLDLAIDAESAENPDDVVESTTFEGIKPEPSVVDIDGKMGAEACQEIPASPSDTANIKSSVCSDAVDHSKADVVADQGMCERSDHDDSCAPEPGREVNQVVEADDISEPACKVRSTTAAEEVSIIDGADVVDGVSISYEEAPLASQSRRVSPTDHGVVSDEPVESTRCIEATSNQEPKQTANLSDKSHSGVPETPAEQLATSDHRESSESQNGLDVDITGATEKESSERESSTQYESSEKPDQGESGNTESIVANEAHLPKDGGDTECAAVLEEDKPDATFADVGDGAVVGSSEAIGDVLGKAEKFASSLANGGAKKSSLGMSGYNKIITVSKLASGEEQITATERVLLGVDGPTSTSSSADGVKLRSSVNVDRDEGEGEAVENAGTDVRGTSRVVDDSATPQAVQGDVEAATVSTDPTEFTVAKQGEIASKSQANEVELHVSLPTSDQAQKDEGGEVVNKHSEWKTETLDLDAFDVSVESEAAQTSLVEPKSMIPEYEGASIEIPAVTNTRSVQSILRTRSTPDSTQVAGRSDSYKSVESVKETVEHSNNSASILEINTDIVEAVYSPTTGPVKSELKKVPSIDKTEEGLLPSLEAAELSMPTSQVQNQSSKIEQPKHADMQNPSSSSSPSRSKPVITIPSAFTRATRAYGVVSPSKTSPVEMLKAKISAQSIGKSHMGKSPALPSDTENGTTVTAQANCPDQNDESMQSTSTVKISGGKGKLAIPSVFGDLPSKQAVAPSADSTEPGKKPGETTSRENESMQPKWRTAQKKKIVIPSIFNSKQRDVKPDDSEETTQHAHNECPDAGKMKSVPSPARGGKSTMKPEDCGKQTDSGDNLNKGESITVPSISVESAALTPAPEPSEGGRCDIEEGATKPDRAPSLTRDHGVTHKNKPALSGSPVNRWKNRFNSGSATERKGISQRSDASNASANSCNSAANDKGMAGNSPEQASSHDVVSSTDGREDSAAASHPEPASPVRRWQNRLKNQVEKGCEPADALQASATKSENFVNKTDDAKVTSEHTASHDNLSSKEEHIVKPNAAPTVRSFKTGRKKKLVIPAIFGGASREENKDITPPSADGDVPNTSSHGEAVPSGVSKRGLMKSDSSRSWRSNHSASSSKSASVSRFSPLNSIKAVAANISANAVREPNMADQEHSEAKPAVEPNWKKNNSLIKKGMNEVSTSSSNEAQEVASTAEVQDSSPRNSPFFKSPRPTWRKPATTTTTTATTKTTTCTAEDTPTISPLTSPAKQGKLVVEQVQKESVLPKGEKASESEGATPLPEKPKRKPRKLVIPAAFR